MTIRSIIGTFILLTAVACGGDKGPAKTDGDAKTAEAPAKADDEADEPAAEAEPELPPQVAKAAKLASAIDANPENADSILEDAGMNREDLNTLMFEIAADADLSAAYQQARAG